MANHTTYGYVRVSTCDQNVARQVAKMEALGIEAENVFIDHASGKSMDRPEWTRLMRTVESGDQIVVDSVDRLGRDFRKVVDAWNELVHERGVDIKALDLDFMDSRCWRTMGDVGDLMENMILSLLAWVAQAERKKILQRQAEGIAVAKANGVYKGRKPMDRDESLLASLVAMEQRNEISARSAAKELGVCDRTYRRWRDQIVGIE